MSSEGGVSSPLASHFDDIHQQRDAAMFGMWLFLGTEVLLFGGMFTAYTAYRCWYNADFEAASSRLNVLIGSLNTLVLLTSSLTMALAVYAAKLGKRRMMLVNLAITVMFGFMFMGFKTREYYVDYVENLIPGTTHFVPDEWTHRTGEIWGLHPGDKELEPVSPARVQLFFMFYYIMTGIHALHVSVGIGLLIWLWVKAYRGNIPPERYIVVEVTGLYWHFVDVVWIFLLPLMYLIGTHSPHDLLNL
jgi:cytochrome c oxidase subunit 3